MALSDISATATARRIQDIADAAKKAFEAQAEQSAQLDAAAREAAAREEADLEAAKKRRAEAEAKATEDPKPEPKTPPKPATMSLGAEEFKLDRQARAAESAKEPRQDRPGRTLKLGAQDEPAEQGKPARKRPSRPEGDDDMSGRTWLR